MYFARLNNNEVVEYPLSYDSVYNRFLKPNNVIYGQLDLAYLLTLGIVKVKTQEYPSVGPTAVVSGPVPRIINGEWVEIYDIREMTQEEISYNAPAIASQIRAQRKILLQQSDWTQIPDAIADKIAWAEYRQELRDITTQSGFPWNITWPTPPTN